MAGEPGFSVEGGEEAAEEDDVGEPSEGGDVLADDAGGGVEGRVLGEANDVGEVECLEGDEEGGAEEEEQGFWAGGGGHGRYFTRGGGFDSSVSWRLGC